VTSVKILDGAIATSDLAANAVTTDKIADGTIVDADISGSIAPSKIAQGALNLGGNALTATGTVSLGATTVTGDLTASGDVDVTGTLDVDGTLSGANVTAAGDLTVSGSAATLPPNSVSGSEASANLRKKVACIPIDLIKKRDKNYIFVAPSACTILAIKLVTESEVPADASDYWELQVRNLTQSLDLLDPVRSTQLSGDNVGALSADTANDLDTGSFLQNASLVTDDVLQLQITERGHAPNIEDILVVVVYEVTN